MPNNQPAPRVLVFDSGLGGLSVAAEIRKLLPMVQILYAADNAFFPYGTMDEAALLQRVRTALLYLQRRHQPDIIVLACNTASTLVLAELRAATATPIVGVVPAVKPAAETTSSGVIGLLATPGTVLRQYTAELIEQYAGHCEVVSVGSAELVEMAEQKMRGASISQQGLQDILAPFHQHPRTAEIDTIVLACTHFPLLREDLSAAFGRKLRWLDSGEAIARRVESLLSATLEPGRLDQLDDAGPNALLCSAPLPRSEALDARLKTLGILAPAKVSPDFR